MTFELLSPACGPRSTRAAGVAIGLLLATPGTAAAQRFGQWWWEATARAEQRHTENFDQDRRIALFTRSALNLSGELNGYILHPSVGSFRLGIDALLSDFKGGRFEASDQLGAALDLSLFPRGRVPLTLFARRTTFDYTALEGDDPLSALLREPGRQTRWGAALSVRSGPLRGLQLNADSSRLGFLDPEATRGVHDAQRLGWSRTAGDTRHNLRLSMRRQDYGFSDLAKEDRTAFVNERGKFGEEWIWQLNGSGIQRDYTTSTSQRAVDDYRLFGRISGPTSANGDFELSTEADLTRIDASDTGERWGGSVLHRWELSEKIYVGPFVSYQRQSSESQTLRFSRLGVSVTRIDRARLFDSTLTLNSAYGTQQTESEAASGRQQQLDLRLVGTVAHGRPSRLRKQLELEWARNDLSADVEEDSALPLVRAFGPTDRRRARLTLARNRSGLSSSLWLDWAETTSQDLVTGTAFTSDTWQTAVTADLRRLRLQVGAGETQVERPQNADEEIVFVTASLGWTPVRGLNLQSIYRQDRNSTIFFSDLDGELKELRLTYSIGLLDIGGRVFDSRRQVGAEAPRVNRGFDWSISRRFFGLLPIISAPGRRGVIR